MVYKLVIIDDNLTTVKSLSQCFDWKELGIELVGTANDGMQGKDLILRTHPDIIITDINMPDIDGLSMIEQVYDELSSSKIIVITGYDEFQYASRAIKLSVFDFILKPIDDNELRKSLTRVIESLDKDRRAEVRIELMRDYMRRAQLVSLLTESPGNDTYVGTRVQQYGIEFSSYFIIAAHSKNGISQPLLRHIDTEHMPEGLNVITLIIDDDLVALCMYGTDENNWRKSAERISTRMLYHEPEFTIAISNLHHSYHHIRDAYQEAKWMLVESRLLDADGYIRFYGESKENKSSRIIELEQKCRELVYDIDQSEILYHEVYNKMMEITKGDIIALRIMLLYYCTMIVQEWFPKDVWAEIMDKAVYGIVRINTSDEACDYLSCFFTEIDKTGNRSNNFTPLVRKVLYCINMHAIEGLRLEDLAKKLYVSPNYLSATIKKETGIKYQQHILNAKIKVAKQMLDDTRMRIEEIAHAVGYENYVSFYNTFKRMEGKTPTEYRLRRTVE